MKERSPLEKQRENLGRSLCKSLEARGFKTHFVPDAEGACELVRSMVPAGSSVGVPGTVSIRQAGIIEALEAEGCTVVDHWRKNPDDDVKEIYLRELLADYFITGCNAVSRDGVMVNVDGTGNRLAGMAWGKGKIIYIIGINKVTDDTDSAVARVRHTAAPPNGVRIGLDTPCATLGYCVDCNSPDRMCNVMLITERAPKGRDCTVIVVGEPLGY